MLQKKKVTALDHQRDCFFQFQEDLYEQTDGVAMGSPTAPLLADVCMTCMFDQASPSLDQNTVLIRYIDVFCVTSNQTVVILFHVAAAAGLSAALDEQKL